MKGFEPKLTQLFTTLGRQIVPFARSWGQRSRSRSDDHRNVVSLITRELLKEFELIMFSKSLGQRSRSTLPKFRIALDIVLDFLSPSHFSLFCHVWN